MTGKSRHGRCFDRFSRSQDNRREWPTAIAFLPKRASRNPGCSARIRCMRFAGILPMDAPDPRIELAELQKLMPIPVLELVTQPALEDLNAVGLLSGRDNSGLSDMAVSITYTLWRNPKDHSDPINLADLDEQTRQSIENEPSWQRPAWIVEMAQRKRYPQLWDAVRTTWLRDPSEHSPVNGVLVNHANHILMNQYRHGRHWPTVAS